MDFDYSMSVRRLNETPRPSKPFTEEDWARVEEVARNVDADLAAQDVRLTMGGEPTFVGIDEPESPQWNIDALGPMKRTRGLASSKACAREMAPGATASLRAGQMVSGRAVSALGAELLLARRRRPHLGECRSHCARRSGLQLQHGRCLAIHGSAHAPSSGERRKTYCPPTTRRGIDGAGWIHFAHSPPSAGRPVVLVEPAVVSSPGAIAALCRAIRPSAIAFRPKSMPWVAPDEIQYEHEAAPFADRVKLPSHPARRMDLFEKSRRRSAARRSRATRKQPRS